MAKGSTKSFRIDDLLYQKTNHENSNSETVRGTPGMSEIPRNVSQNREHRHEIHELRSNVPYPEVVNKNVGNPPHSKMISVKNDKSLARDQKISSSSSNPIKPVAILNGSSSSQIRHLTPYQTSSSPLNKMVAPDRFLNPFIPFYDHAFHSSSFNGATQNNSIYSNPMVTTGHHMSQIGNMVYATPSVHANSSLQPPNPYPHSQNDHRAHSHHAPVQHPVIHPIQHQIHPTLWDHPILQNQYHVDCRNSERAALLLNLHHSRLASYGVAYPNGRPVNSLLNVTNKRKGGQIRFSNAQTAQLEKSFAEHKYLNANDRKKLANSLGLSDRQVKTWFQNRRAKWRKSRQGSTCDSETQVSGSSYSKQDQDYSPDDGGRCDSPNSIGTEDSSC